MRAALPRGCLHILPPGLFVAYLSANVYSEHFRFRLSPLFWAARPVMLALILVLTAWVFFFTVVRSKRAGLLFRLTVATYAVFSVLLLLEGVFVFIPRSHAVGYSLASQTWRLYYFRPYNRLGYRDRPFDPEQVQDRIAVVALGDSFTAGAGIESASDRYSDRLQAMLPANYHVFNAGRGGSDSRDEFRRLLEYPVRPRILILQYFGNDIDAAAVETGRGMPPLHPYQNVPSLLRPLFMGSCLANYFYWRFPQPELQPYFDGLIAAYEDPHTLGAHLDDLHRFVDFSHANQVPMVVVIFPFPDDLQKSRVFIAPVEHLFSAGGVPAIDVSRLVAAMPVRERVVNSNDGHPSKAVHKLVAEELRKVLGERGWVF